MPHLIIIQFCLCLFFRKSFVANKRSSPLAFTSNVTHSSITSSSPSSFIPGPLTSSSHRSSSSSSNVHNYNHALNSNNVPKSLSVPNQLLSTKSSLLGNGLNPWNCAPLMSNFGVYGSLPFPPFRTPNSGSSTNSVTGHLGHDNSPLAGCEKPFPFGMFPGSLDHVAETGALNGPVFSALKKEQDISDSDKKEETVVTCQSKCLLITKCSLTSFFAIYSLALFSH